MDRRLVRAVEAGPGGRGRQGEDDRLMLNALADLATRRSRTVIVSALVASSSRAPSAAGVASRLEPYGADDPATESVQADDRLEAAGYQRASA